MSKTQSVYYPLYNNTDKFIILITGGRGCERPDQEIIMADLSIKKICDVKIGEYVMGDDGAPRKVLDTYHGHSEMYRVHQTSAEDYYVNDAHIISIKKSGDAIRSGRYPNYSEFTDMNVVDFMNSSKRFRDRFRGYKVNSIPYKEQSVEIEPYMLGVWLGDGTSIYPQITTPDKEIKDYLQEYAAKNGMTISLNGKRGEAETLRLRKSGGNTNPFLDKLRDYDLIDNKHIPQEYISNSEEVRLELLAGLLDTDGCMSRNGYEIIQKRKELAKQTKYIADTLGFRTSITEKRAKIYDKDCGVVYRVFINGDVWRIPCKVERKKVYKDDVCKNKDWHLSQLSIEYAGNGEWCGIHLDGNQRYIHSDGTVTHNSGKSYNSSRFIERLTFEYNPERKLAHQILYTRYTMTSANISVIPEFWEKVEVDDTEQFFRKTKTDVVNTMTGARVMFRGIHTSSGNQTAKLKSIQGVTTFVVDEAEEWVSEDEFERIMLSIRTKGLQNRVVIIMNPADSNHWVYKRFIEKTHKIVEYDGVPVQISTHPNVLHIHTTYLDNIQNLSEEFLKEVLDMKINKPERYAHIVMGRWADVAEGAVFKKWGIVDEFPPYAKKIARAMDFGYTCFKGDTLITTMRGDIPIKDIEIGDYVLTRKGYRRVRNKMHNGIKNVITKEIIVNGTKYILSATYEHNINVNGKWKKYGELTEKDNLFVLSSIKGSNTKDTQVANIQIITTTNGKAKGNIIKNFCTMLSMRIISGKYQTGKSYTILTKIRSIMSRLTLWLSHLQNILDYTKKNWLAIKQQNTQEVSVLPKKIGNNGEKKSTRNLQTLSRNVSNVVKSLYRLMFTKDSARNIVATNGCMLHQRITQNSNVSAVEKSLWGTNTLNPKPAQASALINSHGIEAITTLGEEKCDVYDLEIEGIHEYFANGILVHNCDPTAIVRCGIVDNRLYIDELCYRTGMTSGDIIRELRKEEANGEGGFVYSESADPRLIDEIALGGVIIYPVIKGQGSILEGLSKMLDMEIYVTKRSVNLQEELRNYVYAKDKWGNYTNYPEDHHNHGVGDAARYYVMGCIEGRVMHPKRVTKEQLGVY